MSTDAAAHACVEWLRRNGEPPLTFYPLATVRAKPVAERLRTLGGTVRLALDLLDFPPELARAYQAACGCARGQCMCADLTQQPSAPHGRVGAAVDGAQCACRAACQRAWLPTCTSPDLNKPCLSAPLPDVPTLTLPAPCHVHHASRPTKEAPACPSGVKCPHCNSRKCWCARRRKGAALGVAVLTLPHRAARNTLVCETVAEARRLAFQGPERHKVVALDGTLIAKAGLITGGITGNEAARASRWDDQALDRLKAARAHPPSPVA